MRNDDRFGFHPSCTIHPTQARGIKELLECLRSRSAIYARQNSAEPVSLGAHSSKWLICETSGSTGEPKKIRRTALSWIESFEITRAHFGVHDEDIYGVFGALGHSLSLYATLEAFHIGADLCLLYGKTPKAQIEDILQTGITVLYATPTQLNQISAASRFSDNGMLPGVRIIFVGGGMLGAESKERFSQLFPNAKIIEFYGTSETSFITLSDPRTPAGSVGRAYPKVEIKIDEFETNQEQIIGEIAVKSPYLFHCYGGGHRQYAFPEDGYFRTGEIGYLNGDGYVFLLGRVDRMVTVADVNVYPERIETTVASLAGIEHCAVVTRPDSMRGHAVICFIQTNVEVPAATIRKYCQTKLGSHYVPKEIYSIDKMLFLPSGKPDLVTLQNWLLQNQ